MEFHQFNGRVILASDQTTHNCTSLRLKSPDTSTLNASFFSRLFFLFYFFVYFILTIKFCFSLQSLFGKEADKLEQANDDDKTCILCLIRSINLVQFACQFKPVAVLLCLLTSLLSLLKLANEE